MAEQQLPDHRNTSDEIDLGQLFQMIGNGFQRLGRFFSSRFYLSKKEGLDFNRIGRLGGCYRLLVKSDYHGENEDRGNRQTEFGKSEITCMKWLTKYRPILLLRIPSFLRVWEFRSRI